MGTVLFTSDVFMDNQRLDFSLFDDHLEWRGKPSSTGLRAATTSFRTQLALSPLVASAQLRDATTLPLSEIESFTWYELQGQINIQPVDAPLFYFHVMPAKRAPAMVTALDPAWKAARAAAARRVSSRPPEGWLADPDNPGMLRWWDGEAWGEFRKPA
ncbi:MAG: DUF2510 domain-containing protein [Pseudolysinimonas sp.]